VGEEIAGLCLCDVNKEHIARIGRQEGWVDILGVRRAYRHRGLGRALLLAGLHALKEAGMESATPLVLRHLSYTLGPEAQGFRATRTGPKDSGLGVDADSLTGATRLYESVGFAERRRYILYRRPL